MIMNYRKEALDIQKQILRLISEEDFNGIEDLLEKRKEFYINYSQHNSEELKEFLNSEEFKKSEINISKAFNNSKEKIKNELDLIKSSRHASKQYRSNASYRNMNFNKKV